MSGTETIYLNPKETASSMGIDEDALKAMRSESWFPKAGFVNGKGYAVELVKEAHCAMLVLGGNSLPAYVINRKVFHPTCPRGEHHAARVKKGQTEGRIRRCICDTCGNEFTEVGEYPDIRSETLYRMAKYLDSAERVMLNGVRVILIEDATVKSMTGLCRGAILRKE